MRKIVTTSLKRRDCDYLKILFPTAFLYPSAVILTDELDIESVQELQS
jgi:hypothetical protein